MSTPFLHLFTDKAAVCLLLSIFLVSPPLMLMQLQDLLTSMTSWERCSISRGCEHDQVGTSLSSFGYKGRAACDRTLPPTEKHQLLFAADGCCPFTSIPLFNLSSFFECRLHLLSFTSSQILCFSSISFECTHVREVKGV